jgi:hypothetical protein
MTLLRALAVAAVLVTLNGCSAPPSGAPAEFLERESLSSCGEVTLAQGEEIPQSAIDCMTGSGVELSVTRPTTEGDPITSYFRTRAEGGLEFWADSTQDQWSDKSWHLYSCPDATTVLELGNCVEVL